MFLLNAGRYVVADPDVILNAVTLKMLWGARMQFGSFVLKTANGPLLALPAGKRGRFLTDTGISIITNSGYIGFVPYKAAEKLLPYGIIRLTLLEPAMLFFNEKKNIVLDGKLKIFVNQD